MHISLGNNNFSLTPQDSTLLQNVKVIIVLRNFSLRILFLRRREFSSFASLLFEQKRRQF